MFRCLVDERMPSLCGKKIMMVGIDLSHSTTEQVNGTRVTGESTVGCVAVFIDGPNGMEETKTYFNTCVLPPRQTLLPEDHEFVKSFVASSLASNGAEYMPDEVIVSRDEGVKWRLLLHIHKFQIGTRRVCTTL